MVDLVEHAFCLSEASNMPALMELRIRACHVRGSFVTKDNQAPAISAHHLMAEPANFDYRRLAHHRHICAKKNVNTKSAFPRHALTLRLTNSMNILKACMPI
jgi:indolepyruvate ferredoxin oxidoreductase alpha subunit